MNRWFRFYDDAINDPKVLRLSDEAFRGWVSLLCVASKSGGKLPPTVDLEFHLRMKPARVAALIAGLVQAGLLDRVGDTYEPHNWGGRQYISDSTQRVKRHREKRAAAGLDPQWQPSKTLRNDVYKRDGFACVYCSATDDLTIDHKVSEMRGGTHDFDNLHTACRRCNASKRDLTHDEFVARRVTSSLLETHQTTEQKTEQITEARASGASASDPRTRLFRDGLAKLASLTGKGPDACRSFVGKCLKAAGDDAVTVLGLIEDAERNQVVDPSAWIAARLKGPDHGKQKSSVIQAADSLIAKLAEFDGAAGSVDDLRGDARQDSPRLLSHG